MERATGTLGPGASPLEGVPRTWKILAHWTSAHLYHARSDVFRRKLLRHMDIQHVS